MNTARLTRKAIEMLSTAVGLTAKSRPMVGRATLTMVTSMIDMNMAATKTTLTATFWLMRACTKFLFPERSASAAIPASTGASDTAPSGAGESQNQSYQIVSILSISSAN